MVKSRRRHRRRRNDKRKSLRKRGGVRDRDRDRSTSPVGAPEHEPDRNINKLKHFYVKKLQKDSSGSFEPGALTQGHFMFGKSLYRDEIPVEVVDIRSMITGRSLFDSDPNHPDKYKGVVTNYVNTEKPASLRLQKQTKSGEYVRGDDYYIDNFIDYWINDDPATTPENRGSKHELGLLHQLTFEPN